MTKREKIIHSAIQLFCSLGFQNTSTTKITKDAGVGTGTLFLYFKSKDELVNSIYMEIKREMMAFHLVFADQALSFKDQLNGFWVDVVSWGISNPDKFKFMMQFKNSPYISQLTVQELQEEHQFVEGVMKQAAKDGVIIDQPFEFLITVFTSQFNAIIQYLSTQDGRIHQEMIQTSFDVLWNGIKK
ncbi:transcriptional regulator, TetR family [Reichenbachiella faecimaris]|uniref:Transcriptional regulator, TetR family n=1 Tax=Reichenbachiella faecimaris TaxID=692418 RepID=A0A1W2G755_REIFA|nr:TetR/AcrR family transcriptional regulator [Reichenbachiella faecimaris]SMD32509.1 transcriptional regulator, TetR family [Reichenbachiella faecimaris]